MMADAGYDASVERAILANGLLRKYEGVLRDLPARVAAIYPLEVAALQSVHVQDEMVLSPTSFRDVDRLTISAATLTLCGYSPPMSESIARDVRMMRPDLSPEMFRLMSGSMLCDEFGLSLGTVLEQTLTDPSSQPILHALLFEAHKRKLYATRRCDEVVYVARATLSPDGRLDADAMSPWQLRDTRKLPSAEATHRYHQLAGGRILPLNVPIIHAMEYSNADQTKITPL